MKRHTERDFSAGLEAAAAGASVCFPFKRSFASGAPRGVFAAGVLAELLGAAFGSPVGVGGLGDLGAEVTEPTESAVCPTGEEDEGEEALGASPKELFRDKDGIYTCALKALALSPFIPSFF